MKFEVIIKLKPDVLDVEGKAILKVSKERGFGSIRELRVGKVFEINYGEDLSEAECHEISVKIAQEILVNSVIEDFEVRKR